MENAKCRNQYQFKIYRCRYRKCITILTSGNAASKEWIPGADVIHFIFQADVYFKGYIF